MWELFAYINWYRSLPTVIFIIIAENNGGYIMTKKIHSDKEKISQGYRESETRRWQREGGVFVMAGWALACGWTEIKDSSSWASMIWRDLSINLWDFRSALEMAFRLESRDGDASPKLPHMAGRMLWRGQWHTKQQQWKDRNSRGCEDCWLGMYQHFNLLLFSTCYLFKYTFMHHQNHE